jgi:hypothetical protein
MHLTTLKFDHLCHHTDYQTFESLTGHGGEPGKFLFLFSLTLPSSYNGSPKGF